MARTTIRTEDITASEVTTAKMATDPTNASNLASGTVGTARMGSGSASSSTVLHGNNTWAEVSGGTSWQAVQTTGFTAVAGNGYPVNTSSGAITVTLPSSASVGDSIEFVDYASTFTTSKVTVAPNGLKIEGGTGDKYFSTSKDGIRLVYLDATQGWRQAARGNMTGSAYPAATGPDEAAGVTDGDYKYHVFNSSKSGTNGFVVTEPGTSSGSTAVEYLVIAGGGAGCQSNGGGAGGGGAGGYRNSCSAGTEKSGRDSSLESTTTVTVQQYTVTVGAGASGASAAQGANGSDSVWSTITSLGGGGGGSNAVGADGGSGGGGGEISAYLPGGDGTAGQGFDGYYGIGASSYYGGGGGGAGGTNIGSTTGRDGGAGLSSAISSSSVARGGGGGASGNGVAGGSAGTGGGGAGGSGSGGGSSGTATSGTANTGGGSGGWYQAQSYVNGGSGIVVIRYKFQN